MKLIYLWLVIYMYAFSVTTEQVDHDNLKNIEFQPTLQQHQSSIVSFLSELIKRNFPVRTVLKSYVAQHTISSQSNTNTDPNSFTTHSTSSQTEIFPISLIEENLSQPETLGIVLVCLSQWRLWIDTNLLPLSYLYSLSSLYINITIPISIEYNTTFPTYTNHDIVYNNETTIMIPLQFRTMDDALLNLIRGTKLLHRSLSIEELTLLYNHPLPVQPTTSSSDNSLTEDYNYDQYIQTHSLTNDPAAKETLHLVRLLLRRYIMETFYRIFINEDNMVPNSSVLNNHVETPIIIMDFEEMYHLLNNVGTLSWEDMHISLDNFLYLLLHMVRALGINSNSIQTMFENIPKDTNNKYPAWSILITPNDLSIALVDRFSGIRLLTSLLTDTPAAADIWRGTDELLFRKEWETDYELIQQYQPLIDFIHEYHESIILPEEIELKETFQDGNIMDHEPKNAHDIRYYYEFPVDKDVPKLDGYVAGIHRSTGRVLCMRTDSIHPLSFIWSNIYEDSLLTLTLLHLGRIQYQNISHLHTLHSISEPEIHTEPSIVEEFVTFTESITSFLMREPYVPKRTSIDNAWNITIQSMDSSLSPQIIVDIPVYSSVPQRILMNDVEAYDILSALSFRGIEPARIVLGYRIFHKWNTFPVVVENNDRCQVALDLVMAVSNIAIADINAATRLIDHNDVAPLWEAYEDSEVQTLVTTNEVNAELLRAQADLGDAEAAANIGELMVHGHPAFGIPQDINAAIDYLAYAAHNNGPPRAATTLAILMLDSMKPNDPRRNLTEAMIILRKAAEEGNDDALSSLGYVYLTGNVPGEPKNITLALDYLSRSAEAGNINAHSNLASLYLGSGGTDEIPFNGTKARFHLEAAAKAGFSAAVYNLGLLELHGWDSPDNTGNCTAAFLQMLKVAYIGHLMDEYPWLLTTAYSLHMKQMQFQSIEHFGDTKDSTSSTIEPFYSNSEQALVHSVVLSVIGIKDALDNTGFLLESHDFLSHSKEGYFLPRLNLWEIFQDAYFVEDKIIQNIWFNENTAVMHHILSSQAYNVHPLYRNIHGLIHSNQQLLSIGSRYDTDTLREIDEDLSVPISASINFTINLQSAAYRYYAESEISSTHAMFRRAMCFAEAWDSVLPCSESMISENGNTQDFNRTEYVLSLLQTCMMNEDSRCAFTLSNGYATGSIGKITIIPNITQAWLLLDYCTLYDPIHTTPIIMSKLWILGKWFLESIVYFWTLDKYNDDQSIEYSLYPFITSLMDSFWSDIEINNTIITIELKNSRNLEGLLQYYSTDGIIDEAETQKFTQYLALLYNQAHGRKYFLGPFPISESDRHLCTVITRTAFIVILVGIMFTVTMMYIYCSKVEPLRHPVIVEQPTNTEPLLEHHHERVDEPTDLRTNSPVNIDQEENTNEAKED